jgi:phosphoribosyl 1,2-cyclic phosphodiesterase
VLEFNHDPELLRNGPYPPSLQQRVRSNQGHLANGDSAKLLGKIFHEKLQHVILAHLSETNNLPEIAYREATAAIPETSSREILKISGQDQPTPFFKII